MHHPRASIEPLLVFMKGQEWNSNILLTEWLGNTESLAPLDTGSAALGRFASDLCSLETFRLVAETDLRLLHGPRTDAEASMNRTLRQSAGQSQARWQTLEFWLAARHTWGFRCRRPPTFSSTNHLDRPWVDFTHQERASVRSSTLWIGCHAPRSDHLCVFFFSSSWLGCSLPPGPSQVAQDHS